MRTLRDVEQLLFSAVTEAFIIEGVIVDEKIKNHIVVLAMLGYRLGVRDALESKEFLLRTCAAHDKEAYFCIDCIQNEQTKQEKQ